MSFPVPPTRWPAVRLALARIVWAALALFAVGIFVVSLPVRFEQRRTLCLTETCAEGQLTPETARVLSQFGITPDLQAALDMSLFVLIAVVFWLVGLLIALRRSNDPMALFVSATLLLAGGTVPPGLEVLSEASPIMDLPVHLAQFLGTAAYLALFFLFPNGRFVPAWTRWLTIAFVAFGLIDVLASGNLPPMPDIVSFLTWVLTLMVAVFAQIYRYRVVSTPLERQQTKWLVFGLTVGSAALVAVVLPTDLVPSLAQPGVLRLLYDYVTTPVIIASFLLVPITIGIAILKHRLYDIDVIINRALVYGVLTSLLLAVYIACVVVLQAGFRAATSQESELAVIISTLAIAALFQPLRGRLQALIDRRFYRSRYDAGRALTAFSAHLRDEVDLPTLSDELLGVVRETMQPAHVSLWIRPTSARWSTAPPLDQAEG